MVRVAKKVEGENESFLSPPQKESKEEDDL